MAPLPMRTRRWMGLTVGLCVVVLIDTDLMQASRRSLVEVTKICKDLFYGPNWIQYDGKGGVFLPTKQKYLGYWEDLFGAMINYDGSGSLFKQPYDPNNIGYVLTLRSCPADNYAAFDPHDPGHGFYDAAAILKHSIERSSLRAGSKYNATLKAIVHPEAIRCKGPNKVEYDRVRVLQDLGYQVVILGHPLGHWKYTHFVRNNIDQDAGIRDSMSLHALRFENHPVIVLVDFSTLMMKPMDDVFDAFIQDPNLKAGFSFDYPTHLPNTGDNFGINTHWIMLKPSVLFYNSLIQAYRDAGYAPSLGWDELGVADFHGVLGIKGFFAHYFKYVEPDARLTLNRCQYGNDNSNPLALDSSGSVVCRDPSDCQDCRSVDFRSVKVITMLRTCGKPWECHYDDSWDDVTKTSCERFHKAWFSARARYEEECSANSPPSIRDGLFKKDVFLGYCSCAGITCYERMIDDKAAVLTCDKETLTTNVTGFIYFPNNGYQKQMMSLTTGKGTGTATACVSGKVTLTGFGPPYNIAIAIDVSGSTSATFQGTAVGDVNNDGQDNTILDAEIASIITLLQSIASSPRLGNDNVNIGLTVFSTQVQYRGAFLPCDPNDESSVNPQLMSKLRSLRSGGSTNFGDALDKSILYFQEAPTNRSNLLIFLSDGLANVAGDNNQEPTDKNMNLKPGALEYSNKLAILDGLEVKRIAVGVGGESDVRQGFALDMIDNTPDPTTDDRPSLATSAAALQDSLLTTPAGGKVIDFSVSVNGGAAQANIDASDVMSDWTGFVFGQFVVPGLNPRIGAVNTITVTAVLDYDGDASTDSDQVTLMTTNTVTGSLM